MEYTLADALEWHMEKHGTRIVDLVRNTGVKRSVINKIIRRENRTSSYDNVLLLASFFGKSVNDFIAKKEPSDDERLMALVELLNPAEAKILEAQVSGILRSRKKRN